MTLILKNIIYLSISYMYLPVLKNILLHALHVTYWNILKEIFQNGSFLYSSYLTIIRIILVLELSNIQFIFILPISLRENVHYRIITIIKAKLKAQKYLRPNFETFLRKRMFNIDITYLSLPCSTFLDSDLSPYRRPL